MGHGRLWAGGKGCLQAETSGCGGGIGIAAQGGAPPPQLPGPQLAPSSITPLQSLSRPSQISGEGIQQPSSATPLQSLSIPSQISGEGMQQPSSVVPLQSLSTPSHASGAGPIHPMQSPQTKNSPDASQ